ncbi:hypothetical protein ACVIWU_007501 [Bradyrhizobium sp. USDA 4509]
MFDLIVHPTEAKPKGSGRSFQARNTLRRRRPDRNSVPDH